MERPSGDQRALSASVEMAVIFCGLVVAPVAGSKPASQTCWEPLRLLRKRMRLPSGQTAVRRRRAGPLSSLKGLPPAMAWSHSSAVLVFWLRSAVVTL